MKYSELPKEIQKHFNRVIECYNGYLPKDATHVIMEDPDKHFVLLKIEDGKSFLFLFYDFSERWVEFKLDSELIYKIPDIPWYDPYAVGFDDKIDMSEHGTTLSYKVMDYKEPLKYQETKFKPCKDTIKVVEQVVEDSPEKPTPTGGKSSYYLIEIPFEAPSLEVDNEKGVVRFMLEEYIKYGLNNDFDRGNIAKANHRLGKKLGVKVDYDLNKIEYYTKRIRSTSDE